MKEININNFEEKLYYEKLSNGLEIYLVPKKDRKKYFISFNTKYGNCYGKFKANNKMYKIEPGTAHFLEHKLFEREQETPFEFFGKSGTDVNAGTSIKYTTYYCSGTFSFNNNLKYMLNWLTNINLTEENIEKEKGIILQEIKMTEDNPERNLYDKLRFNTYNNDPYRYKVIGEENTILNISKEKLLACYNAFYRPNNMFLIIVGNFCLDETLKIIKEELKKIKNPKDKITIIKESEENEVSKKEEIIYGNVKTPRVAISYKMPKKIFNTSDYDLNNYIYIYLTMIFGNTSIFFENSLEKRLFYDYGFWPEFTDNYVTLGFDATTDKTDDFIKEIEIELKNTKIEEKDFERIKKVWIAEEIRGIDSVNRIANSILGDVIYYNEYKNNSIEDIRKLDYKYLIKLIEKFDLKNKCIVKILPNSN